MKVLGCDNHPNYKFSFYLDSRAMISIHSDRYGVIEVRYLLRKIFWGPYRKIRRRKNQGAGYFKVLPQLVLYLTFQVKPLGVIWGKFPQYNKDNTIMFDDLRRNFLMNPFNGLKIRPFKNAHTSRDSDTELIKLSAYLKKISTLSSFEELDHKHWERYLAK